MPDDSSIPLRRPLRGMSPSKLLGVFEQSEESPPNIPGWEVLGVAGRGGFGTVWRGLREADGAIAAIKIAPPDDPDTLERIEEEAGSLRALSHPNIVALLDSGPLDDKGGGLFLAMAFIDGPELSQEIPVSGLPAARAYAIFRHIAAAVIHAHERGILHRDLKPGNILLDAHGTAHVADFGLALPVHRRVHQLSMTRAGMVAGTAEYLPPEAYIADYQPSAAADIFALGVILYEMLTGAPPRGAWKPASTRLGVDVRIDEIISRAMDPDPANRWPDVRAMLAALDEVRASPPRMAGTPMVTFPVRVTDALWTVNGLAMCFLGLASLLKLRKFRIELPMDLVGDLPRLLGAFHALFWLSPPALLVGGWQVARLIRFRHTPLREALPSPFGLRLSHGRATAFLVAFSQFLCLVLPGAMMFGFFLDSCLVWLTPADPPWAHGLSVTRWGDGALVSPWSRDPAQGFWLVESHGPLGNPLTKINDRLGFFAFWVPLLMVCAGVCMFAGFLAMLAAACRSWFVRRRFGSLGLLLAATTALANAGHMVASRDLGLSRKSRAADRFDTHSRGDLTRLALLHARHLLAIAAGRESPPAADADWLSHYAESVDFRGRGPTPRSQIASLIRADAPATPAAETMRNIPKRRWDPASGRFSMRKSFYEFRLLESTNEPLAAMNEITVDLEGLSTIDGTFRIDSESLTRQTLLRYEPVTATAPALRDWLGRLQRALAETDPEAATAALADCFLPLPNPSDTPPPNGFPGWIRHAPTADLPWVSALRDELAATPLPQPFIDRSLPGHRTRVAIPLRRDSPKTDRMLFADLVRNDGVWRCIRLAY